MKVRKPLPALVASLVLMAVYLLAGCGSESGSTAGGSGDNYPGGPIQLIAPAAAGGGYDTTARVVLDTLQKAGLVKTPIVVENREGADGSVWMAQMATDLTGDANVISVGGTASMYNDARGDTQHNFHDVTPIASLISEYYVFVVPADSPFQKLSDVVDAVKANPQSVPIGGGSLDRAAFDLVMLAAGGDPAKNNFVEYPTGAEQTVGLLNGDLAVGVAGTPEFKGQIESGELRALAVTRPERFEQEPFTNVPTATEEGYDVTLANWRCIYGPKEMPDYAVTYWKDTLGEMVETEQWTEAANNNQWETNFKTDEQLQQLIDSTYKEIEDAYRATGVIQ
ncbi:tripartite tricarboxylate transporter substrate binding protein [Mycobacterium neglectum]|uniref:tripartite tricarboxylate transporter substrate binding protein n=1 Tax=Mycobacterium neglectum TaxID=242737 RepID=UPI000BFEAB97|nr:tripartite tricarboxylate transporter substrate-binding protein [Mycobacterium neglectum]